ncbi:hypothetical protein PP506_gp55 [Gordonia phage DobbysSock]|uniref:Uncharacterized protein n=1 Tax=Gordonia phage DobbysSock TaxID=2652880 RepID=A0A5P8DAZ9_9CAUD|nr:hypothetical protein PP506_gp55 [Gordonia phage DobbysSock]QFP96176.1 hypothetical protein DOBBYSSOCK_SEA_55 [Gordonia phage DobbysSock]
MTTPNLEQIIAEHQNAPLYWVSGYQAQCSCGWSGPKRTDYTHRFSTEREHAAHVAAAIRDSGLTVIALPEGEADDDGQVWFDDFDIRVDTTGRREDIHLYVNGEPRSPDATRRHASALLAAAQVAERNNP